MNSATGLSAVTTCQEVNTLMSGVIAVAVAVATAAGW